MLETLQYGLGAASGAVVGFSLGLVGGGGSILAVPLMVYLVGVANPHVAIGTSALAVAANAASGRGRAPPRVPTGPGGGGAGPKAAGGGGSHARSGTVKWRCGGLYAVAGVL